MKPRKVLYTLVLVGQMNNVARNIYIRVYILLLFIGTQVPCAEMPAKQLAAFLNVFKELSEQRVLWKCEGGHIPDLPKNVLIEKWLPQNDILAHPNVRVFITHGGLFGSQEGVHYGVPMLGIPFYADQVFFFGCVIDTCNMYNSITQHLNTNKAALNGYAVKLEFTNVTVDSLRWALNELLHNPSYSAIANDASRIFRDRPERPIDRATYWIEYVIRFNGTGHLSSAGRNLSWCSYFLLDVLAVFLIAVSISMVVIRCVFRKQLGLKNKPLTKTKFN